jgi:hypothetical protein
MKKLVSGLLAVAALTAVGLSGGSVATASKAEARPDCSLTANAAVCNAYRAGLRRGYRRGDGGTTVIQGGSGLDVNSLLLMQALSGGSSAGLASVLPFLLTQPQTTVVESRRSRR